MITIEAIYHRPHQNWAYAYDEQMIHLRIRAKRGECSRVECWAGDKYAWEDTNEFYDLDILASDQWFDYWQLSIKPTFQRLFYAFRLTGNNDVIWFTDQGAFSEYTNMPWRHFEFPFMHKSHLFDAPNWVRDAIFYQIFPERFANGDESLNPPNVDAWGAPPTYTNFFGGDLVGVIKNLDYLQSLGINALYFTPLFTSPSNHKYDTANYLEIDPHFGTKETLKQLVDECHRRGIRVMLDAVFNHSGQMFPPFLDLLEHGEQSRFKDWFHVKQFPLQVVEGVPTYHTFAFSARMPKFNTSNPDLRNYLLEVARYWIEEVGIDGWRLDVANEIEYDFWRDFRKVVKSISPDVYILGEVWHDAMPWLEGDQFDAAMNYPLTNAILDFFARQVIDAKGFADLIGQNIGRFQSQVHEVAFNIIDSHDTERILTLLQGNSSLLKLASLFQFTYLGTPCIYYGTEIGLDGGFDPDCRKCMIWDEAMQDLDLLQHYQFLTKLRTEYTALRFGRFRILDAQQNSRLIIYERADDDDRFIIAINADNQDLSANLSESSFVRGMYESVTTLEQINLSNEMESNILIPAYHFLILKQKI
jgi:glycosidase